MTYVVEKKNGLVYDATSLGVTNWELLIDTTGIGMKSQRVSSF